MKTLFLSEKEIFGGSDVPPITLPTAYPSSSFHTLNKEAQKHDGLITERREKEGKREREKREKENERETVETDRHKEGTLE